ncbi:tdpoz3 [Trichonephila clavata]|uniref:Tdpoz3 n=1 Tax=Trichonephila clavata TaxID=2740835 RepID=A0A8X6M2Q1_TRICU|nr:tdpoz3 [Trichonephila clavata]
MKGRTVAASWYHYLVMAFNSNTESEPWISFLWNIENYSYCWHKDDNDCIETPVMPLQENITWYVETDFALLAEDGLILHINPRFKPRTLDKGVFQWRESLLNLDELAETKRKRFLSRDTLRIRCRLWRTDGKTVIPATFFVRTVLSVKKKSFRWDIERFSSFICGRKETFVLRSESSDQQAVLNIRVNGQSKIVISIKSLHKNIKFLKFKAFMSDTNGCKTDCGGRNVFPDAIKYPMCKLPLPFTKKYLMDNKNVYLKNDVFSLCVECSLLVRWV